MAITLPGGFNITNNEPVDARITVADQSARLGFSSANVYEGLVVYQEDTDELYVLNDASDPSDNNNWSQVGEGTGFPFTGSAGILGSLNVNGITTINTGSFNISIGHPDYPAFPSLDLNNTAESFGNVGLGAGTLFDLVKGSNNFAIGFSSQFSLTSGSGNVAIGASSFYRPTIGFNNVAIGSKALYQFTGSDNVAIGNQALYGSNGTDGDGDSANKGSFNVAVGSLAHNSSNDSYNVAIGYKSFEHHVTGSNNVAIGSQTARITVSGGPDNFIYGNNSVYIGASVKPYANNAENETLIGSGTEGIGPNSVVLGNNSVTTTILKGNVGIGTILPSEKLTVEGNISASGYVSASEGSFGSGTTTINTSINTTGDITGSKLVLTSAGNISNMSLHKSGDVTTGLYFPGPSTVALQAGGGNIELSLSPNFLNTRGSLNHIGSITSSVDIKASGDITGDKFIVVNGGNSENVSIYKSGDTTTGLYFPAPETVAITAAGGDVEFQVSEGLINTEGSLFHTGNITSSANISASGYVSASEGSFGSGATTINTSINTIGSITSSANISASGDVISTNISASGNITGVRGNFNTVSVIGEYTLPSTDGSANQIIKTNGAGVLSFTSLTPIPTIYTPDVYEIESVTGIGEINTVLTFSGSGDPTIIDGTTGTTRSPEREDSITFNSTGSFEISYSVQMQQGESSPGDGKRMNPQVYAKYGVSEETEVIAGSSDITYIRLFGSNQAPNGACTCTFYVNVTDEDHILELLVTFTQPATNIDLDIVQFESVPNTLSIRKIT